MATTDKDRLFLHLDEATVELGYLEKLLTEEQKASQQWRDLCGSVTNAFQSFNEEAEAGQQFALIQLPCAVELAARFRRVMREWFKDEPETLLLIDEQNAVYLAEGRGDEICASHDHCDPNMAMQEAWDHHAGELEMADSIAIVNEAWSIAKRNGFSRHAFVIESKASHNLRQRLLWLWHAARMGTKEYKDSKTMSESDVWDNYQWVTEISDDDMRAMSKPDAIRAARSCLYEAAVLATCEACDIDMAAEDICSETGDYRCSSCCECSDCKKEQEFFRPVVDPCPDCDGDGTIVVGPNTTANCETCFPLVSCSVHPCDKCEEAVPEDEHHGNTLPDGSSEYLCEDCYKPTQPSL